MCQELTKLTRIHEHIGLLHCICLKDLVIRIKYWDNLPVIFRAVLTGFVVTVAGTVPWALLVSLNLKHWPQLPWAALLTAIYIWFYWKYVRGAGWPRATSEARCKNCRAHDLSSEEWTGAIGAGIVGLVALLLFQNVYGRIVALPTGSSEDLTGVPAFTLFLSLFMSAIVAGISEESGLRGYMQRPLEQRYGPITAILVTGTVFGFLHFTHREVTIALMPWYMGVALVYGALAYITNSILPSVVLHAGGNMLGAVQLLAGGRTEWQTSTVPKPLIWESGADVSFWISFIGFITATVVAIWTYASLARTAKRSRAR
jgi:membrane protease YdiL (CAAX protease family)